MPPPSISTTTRTVELQVSVPSDSSPSVGISYAEARTASIVGTQSSYLSCHDRNARRDDPMLELEGGGCNEQPGDEHPLVVKGLLVHQVEAGQHRRRAEQEPMRRGAAGPPDQGISGDE